MPAHTGGRSCKCIQCNMRRKGVTPGRRRVRRVNPARGKRGPLEFREYGLFVWATDGRYYWDERLDGRTYSRATLAERAAEKRNAAGEHGGMLIARPRQLILESRPKSNPKVVTMRANPGKGEYKDVNGRTVRVNDIFRLAGRAVEFCVVKKYLAANFIPSVVGQTLDGKSQTHARTEDIVITRHERGVKSNPKVVTMRANPRRVKANPRRAVVTLSRRALDLSYIHAEHRGQPYRHKFGAGVTIQLLSDGSVRLYRPDGKRIWKDFEEK